MDVQASPGRLSQLRRNAGSFQRTFQTPLKQLVPFANTLLGGKVPVTSAKLTIEAIVFTPKHLSRLLADHSLTPDLQSDSTITATSPQEAHELLVAALGDWVDFYYVPKPGGLLLYADHDEYTTVFAPRKGRLAQLGAAMAEAGFIEVPGYSRVV